MLLGNQSSVLLLRLYTEPVHSTVITDVIDDISHYISRLKTNITQMTPIPSDYRPYTDSGLIYSLLSL